MFAAEEEAEGPKRDTACKRRLRQGLFGALGLIDREGDCGSCRGEQKIDVLFLRGAMLSIYLDLLVGWHKRWSASPADN